VALYNVVTGNTALAADLNQLVNLLNGTTPDTQVTVSNRIRAQMSGASVASGYVGGSNGAPADNGKWVAGDFVSDPAGKIWVCTAGSSPGPATWSNAGAGGFLDTNAAHIQPLGTAAAGSQGLAADSGHVHPTTGVGMLNVANSWTQLQSFTQGLQTPSYSGSAFNDTSYPLAIAYGSKARQLFVASTRNDAKAAAGDILFNAG
jgi:hypothetical protein